MTNEIGVQIVPLLKDEVAIDPDSSKAAPSEQQQENDRSVPYIDPLLQPLFNDNVESNEDLLRQRSSSVFYTSPKAETEKQSDDNDDTQTNKNKTASKFGKCADFLHRFSGIFYAILSSLLFSCTNFVIKQLTVHLMDAMFFRFLAQTLIALIVNIYHGYNPFHRGTHKETLLYLGNALVGTSNSLFFYLSLSLIPLSDLNTIRYSSVIWTAVVALVVFHESKLSLPTLLAIVLTLTGVVCVVQPTFLFSKTPSLPVALNITTTTYLTAVSNSQERYIGLLLALLCAFSISLNIIITKKLFNLYKAKQSVLMFQFSFLTTVTILITQICRRFYSKTNDLQHFLTLKFILASIFGAVQILPVLCYQKAIKREHPSIVTVAQSSDILFSIVLQNMFTNSKSNWLALLGAALVLTSIFLVGGQKLYQDRQARLSAAATVVPVKTKETDSHIGMPSSDLQ